MVFNLTGCVLQGIPSRAAAPAHQVLRGGGEEGPAHPDRLLRPQGGPQATPGGGTRATRGTRGIRVGTRGTRVETRGGSDLRGLPYSVVNFIFSLEDYS